MRKRRECYYCGRSYFRRDVLEAWLDPHKLIAKGGKKTIKACLNCSGIASLMRRQSLLVSTRKQRTA